MQIWDAFLEDYRDEMFNWSPRQLLEVFWHYCQDGSKGVCEFLNKDAILTTHAADKLQPGVPFTKMTCQSCGHNYYLPTKTAIEDGFIKCPKCGYYTNGNKGELIYGYIDDMVEDKPVEFNSKEKKMMGLLKR